MKISISTFTDYQNATYTQQKKLVEQLKLQSLIIRNIEGKSILEYDQHTFDALTESVKLREVIAIDPLIENANLQNDKEIQEVDMKLELAASRAKQLKAKYLIYRIPKFKDFMANKDMVLAIIKKQTLIIKKFKVDILIMPSDDHKTQTYRFILENLKDNKVKIIFHPVYIYKIKEAEITSYRLLREYIGLFLVDDCDQLLSPRLLTKGNAFDLKGLFKKFIENQYEGYVVLDTSLLSILLKAKDYSWIDRTFNKQKKNEYKIYEEYIELKKEVSIYDLLKSQLLVLNLVFLNKKTL